MWLLAHEVLKELSQLYILKSHSNGEYCHQILLVHSSSVWNFKPIYISASYYGTSVTMGHQLRAADKITTFAQCDNNG